MGMPPRGKKDALALAGARSGAFRAVLRLRRSPGPRILAYHRVFEMGDEDAFPFDPELVSATPAQFAWQMAWLRAHMEPVPLVHLLEAMEGRLALPARAVAVTFDDGHLDNYTTAFPILREHRIPATVFVSTDYVDAPRTFWFDEVAFRVRMTSRSALRLDSLGLEIALDGVASRRAAAEAVLERLKAVPEAVRLAGLEELAEATGIPHVSDTRSAPLAARHLDEMASAGIGFGSHTASHPILSRIDAAQLERELGSSREFLRRRGMADADILAYPVGGDEAYDERVIATASACGYRMGLSYTAGVTPWPPEHPFRIRRLHIERYTTRARFVAMLSVPEVFA
jgi:peptidoglycan/xylan/chitin deacetylase (PgdA/CDA1 family)